MLKLIHFQVQLSDRRIVKISVSENQLDHLFWSWLFNFSGVVGTIKISEQIYLVKGQNITLDLTLGGNQNLIKF